MNFFILCLHVTAICSLTLLALRFGQMVLIAWLSTLAIAMNLFVLKQISFFGLNVTSSDALAVGYLLGLNLLQEFFGRAAVKKSIGISFFISCGFVLLSQIHLLYLPNQHDISQTHFIFLFKTAPRLFLASLFSFLIVQIFDSALFSFLKNRTRGKYLTVRTTFTLFFSQALDTLIFSYLGLFGIAASILHILFLSLVVKAIVVFLSAPFVLLSKKVTRVSV